MKIGREAAFILHLDYNQWLPNKQSLLIFSDQLFAFFIVFMYSLSYWFDKYINCGCHERE